MRPFNELLREFGEMENGWDGRGSIAPSIEAIRTTACLTACPLGDGGIQIELHAGGVDLEINIGPGGSVRSVSWTNANS